MNVLIYTSSLIIFILLIKNLKPIFIKIYKNSIFKLIFLFGLYLFGNNDITMTLLLSIYYIYLGQIIQEIELLKNI